MDFSIIGMDSISLPTCLWWMELIQLYRSRKTIKTGSSTELPTGSAKNGGSSFFLAESLMIDAFTTMHLRLAKALRATA